MNIYFKRYDPVGPVSIRPDIKEGDCCCKFNCCNLLQIRAITTFFFHPFLQTSQCISISNSQLLHSLFAKTLKPDTGCFIQKQRSFWIKSHLQNLLDESYNVLRMFSPRTPLLGQGLRKAVRFSKIVIFCSPHYRFQGIIL